MHSSLRAEFAARDGDLRLSFLLGLAAWFLFLDHIPHNVVGLLTMRNFGFSGATDLIVFIGGYAAAVLYGRMALERGSVVTATRIFKRLWQLYAAYVVLFVVYINLIGYVARRSHASELIDEFNVTEMVDHMVRTLIHGLLLQAKPLHLDILQLFVVLLAFFPVVLFGMIRRPNLTMALSIGLYFVAGQLDWNLSSFPDGHWYLNPFSWQLLFVLGARFAFMDAKEKSVVHMLRDFPILRAAAGLYLVFALIVTVAGQWPRVAGVMADVLHVALPNEKEELGPHRVLHFLALAVLFTYLVPRDWRGVQWRALQPVLKCGEEWLATFCAGIFLSFAGHLVLITSSDSLIVHVLVSFAGILVMTGVAYYVSWSRRQDQKSPLRTPTSMALSEEGPLAR
jgi:hypothetical protein